LKAQKNNKGIISTLLFGSFIISAGRQTQGVCMCQSHCGLAILHFKSILRQKKKYGKLKYFTMQKYVNVPKESS
jgi:hypothetical protein